MTLRPRATELLCAGLLLLAALAARLPGINGDLWLDEAWVANSVLAPSWREMFFYAPWLQTTPPLHLIATRMCVFLLGDSNWVFRLLPLLFGLLSVFLMVHVARRLLSPAMGWLAGALVALSHTAVLFSKEGKSYSGELCMALLLMMLIVHLPDWRLAALTLILAFGFSYSSIILFPAVFLAYLWARRLRDAIAIAATVALPLIAVYLTYIQPNQSPDLREMWRYAFATDLGFYPRITKAIFVVHQWLPLRHVALLRQLLLVLALCGIGRAVWQLWKQQDARLLLAGVVPFLCAIAVNLAGRYPYDDERFSVYLIGCVVLLTVSGIHWAWPHPLPHAALLSLLVVALTTAAAFAGPWPRRVETGLAPALHELRQQAATGDLLFLAPLQAPSYALAERHAPLNLETVEGRAVAPCCPRDGRWQAGNRPDEVNDEMDGLIARGTGRRIWLLHLRLLLVNVESQRIPEDWQRAYLQRKGCHEESARVFQSTALAAYRCPLL